MPSPVSSRSMSRNGPLLGFSSSRWMGCPTATSANSKVLPFGVLPDDHQRHLLERSRLAGTGWKVQKARAVGDPPDVG